MNGNNLRLATGLSTAGFGTGTCALQLSTVTLFSVAYNYLRRSWLRHLRCVELSSISAHGCTPLQQSTFSSRSWVQSAATLHYGYQQLLSGSVLVHRCTAFGVCFCSVGVCFIVHDIPAMSSCFMLYVVSCCRAGSLGQRCVKDVCQASVVTEGWLLLDLLCWC